MSVELIAKLFRFKRKIEYVGGVELYMRIPGDQVIDDARTYALLESRKLRRDLRDPASDVFIIHLDGIEDLSNDELLTGCTALAMRDVMRDFVNSTPKPALPELGDYPTQEDQEIFTAAKIERETSYNEDMRLHVDGWRTSFVKSLTKMDDARLRAMYRKLRTDRVCEESFGVEFEHAILAASLFLDEACTQSAFSPSEFKNVPTEFKSFVRDQYNDLSLNGEELKK